MKTYRVLTIQLDIRTLAQPAVATRFARWLNEMSDAGWDLEETEPSGELSAVIFSRAAGLARNVNPVGILATDPTIASAAADRLPVF